MSQKAGTEAMRKPWSQRKLRSKTRENRFKTINFRRTKGKFWSKRGVSPWGQGGVNAWSQKKWKSEGKENPPKTDDLSFFKEKSEILERGKRRQK
jgi:hypothetical protein